MLKPKHSVSRLAIDLLNKYCTLFFVLTAGVFGLMICFRMQPIFGSDELVHFPRAYHVQDGHLWTEHLGGYDHGGYVPVQIKELNDGFREQAQSNHTDQNRLDDLKKRFSTERLDKNPEMVPLAFTSAGVYSAWAYLPAALGVGVADMLHLPLIWYVYLGRLMCLLIYILLVFMALKLLPGGKLFLVTLALLPTSLVQATTIGMDGLVNGLSWVVIALTLAILTKKIQLTTKFLGVIVITSLFLATTKQGYLPIAALPLIIPDRRYPLSKRHTWIFRIGLGILLAGVTTWYLGKTGPTASVMHFIQRPGLYVDSHDQIRYIFNHLFSTLSTIIIQPFTFNYASVYPGFVGILTNKVIYTPLVVMVLSYIALISAFATTRPAKEIIRKSYRYRVVGAFIVIGTFILINLALYVSFTQVGLDRVEGVQGRYFLPLIPLLLIFPLTLHKNPLQPWRNSLSLVAISCTFIGLVTAVIAIH